MKTTKSLNPKDQLKPGLLTLPPEVLFHCFHFFKSSNELIALSKTCHALRDIAFDQQLWQKFQSNKQITRSKIKRKTKHTISCKVFTVLSNGYICSSAKRNINIWSDDQFKLVAQFKPLKTHESLDYVKMLCALPDNQLAIGYRNGQIQIWKLHFDESYHHKGLMYKTTHKLVKSQKLHELKKCCSKSCGVYALTTLPNGRLASGGCRTGRIYIWDINNGKPVTILQGPKKIYSTIIDFKLANFENSILASYARTTQIKAKSGWVGDSHSVIHIWDLNKGDCINRLQVRKKSKKTIRCIINAMKFLPNGFLAIATEGFIQIYDTISGKCNKIISPDTILQSESKLIILEGRYIINWSKYHGVIRAWDVESGTCIKTYSINPQLSLTKRSGELIELKDGRIVCFNYDGVYLFKFPKLPENKLQKNSVNNNKVSNQYCKKI